MRTALERHAAEDRFREVFAHLGAVTAYARRRGSRDADAVAAEVMTIAWRRLADVPADDPRPWLYATARNLLLADARRAAKEPALHDPEPVSPPPDLLAVDPALAHSLRSLSRLDREALLLVAWEDLTPSQAARALGINPSAFRVPLLRARRRLRAALEQSDDPGSAAPVTKLDVERT